MINAILPVSSLKIEGLGKHSQLNVTSLVLSVSNHLYLCLSNGALLVYQLPNSQDESNSSGMEYNGSTTETLTSYSSKHSLTQLNLADIESEEPSLIASYKLPGVAQDMQLLEDLNYLVTLIDGTVYIFSIYNKNLKKIREVDDYKFNTLKAWSDIGESHNYQSSTTASLTKLGIDIDSTIKEEDSQYGSQEGDSISLATVKLADNAREMQSNSKFIKNVTDSSFVAMVSKKHVVILSWHHKGFKGRYEFVFQDKVAHLNFLNSDLLLIGFDTGKFSKLNLTNGLSVPIQLDFIENIAASPQPSRASSFFFGSSNSSLKTSFTANNDRLLAILNDNILVKLNSNFEPISVPDNLSKNDIKGIMTIPSISDLSSGGRYYHNLCYVGYWFPYIIECYGNCLEVHSLETFQLIQRISFIDPKKFGLIKTIKFNSLNLIVATDHGLFKFVKVDYNSQLRQFESILDYRNATNLLDKLNPLILDDEDKGTDNITTLEHSHSARQIKFMRLRQYQIGRAYQLEEQGEFQLATKIFINWLASPSAVLDNLPLQLKSKLKNDWWSSESETKVLPYTLDHKEALMVNSLIVFLTDSRRKISRFLDPDKPKFTWRGYTISLSLYEELQSDNSVSTSDNLTLIDNNLFKCYLLSNPRMIGPFLRIPNYCDFHLVESKCLCLQMYSQLIDFYYIRNNHVKALDLLNRLLLHTEQSTPAEDTNSSLYLIFNAEYMVHYLQKLNNDNLGLIFQYSKKLIELNSGYFKMIFMGDSENSEGLDRERVLAFIQKNQWLDLQNSYLEYVIFTWKDRTQVFIDSLLQLYLTKNQYRLKADNVVKLYDINIYDPSKVLEALHDLKVNDQLIFKLKIKPLTKQERYIDAIKVYIDDLHGYRQAVTYSLKIGKDDHDLGNKLLYNLLEIYLDRNDLTHLLQMLSDTRISFLDSTKILDMLPDNMPLRKVNPYLEGSLKQINTQTKGLTLEEELAHEELIHKKIKQLDIQRSFSYVNEDIQCPVCHRGFNDPALIAFLPNGSAIHYSCLHSFA